MFEMGCFSILSALAFFSRFYGMLLSEFHQSELHVSLAGLEFTFYTLHNGAQTTKLRLDRLLFLSFAGLGLSKNKNKTVPGMSFSVRTAAIEFPENLKKRSAFCNSA